MEITLKVELGLSPRFEELLTRGLEAWLESAYPAREADKPEVGASEVETSEVGASATVAAEVEASGGASATGWKPVLLAPTAPTAPTEAPLVPTDEELRTLMDITISKLAGNNDWKNATDALTLAIRRGCTKTFKEIAAHLGAEKPTALQDEKRMKFIEALDMMTVNREKGEVSWVPF